MKKTLLMILSLGVILNYSCQKSKLYPASQTQVSNQDGQPFATVQRIGSQVLALYNNLRNTQLYGSRYIIYNEVKADNWVNASNNGITAFTVWNATIIGTDSQITGLWASCYTTINNCNLFLDGMAATGTAVIGNTTTSKAYIAEAKLIRALCYYNLLQFYARPYADGAGSKPGVPLRLVGNITYANYDLARSSVADVYTQIIKDLDAAETDLPSSYLTGTALDANTNTTRAHKNTAIALKTRVYLSMQKYTNVITEANKIVPAVAPFAAPTGVPNALQADITKVFTSPYTTTESIFSMPYNTNETPAGQSQLCSYFYSNSKVIGNAEFNLNPAGVVADPNWKATDKRRGFITTVTATKLAFSKFPILSPYTDWVPVIRYAEVLLNLAEARVRSTNTVDVQAIALLNAIRGRSDASTVFTVVGFANSGALADAIFQERNIELLGEGFRNADLMRLLATIPAKGSVPAIPSTDPRYIWPMSGDELLYNKLMTP